MGQDPEVIRRDIEQTRERMGETVGALGYKADVPARTKEAVSERVTSVKEKITGATPDTGEVKQAARRGAGVAQENPLGLAIGAVAAGFLAGMLIPSTRVEDEKLGPMADQAKEAAKQTGQEALEHGKQVAQDVASTVQETAQESAAEHGRIVKDTAVEQAQQVRT